MAHTCDASPALREAFELQRLALALLPPCRALDPAQEREPLHTLEACSRLEGHRLAAAAALKSAHNFGKAYSHATSELLAGRFHPDGVVEWMGARSGKGEAARHFWVEHMAKAGRPALLIERVEGKSAARVRITGQLTRWVGPASDRSPQSAPVEFDWLSRTGGAFQVARITVGQWEAQNLVKPLSAEPEG